MSTSISIFKFVEVQVLNERGGCTCNFNNLAKLHVIKVVYFTHMHMYENSYCYTLTTLLPLQCVVQLFDLVCSLRGKTLYFIVVLIYISLIMSEIENFS